MVIMMLMMMMVVVVIVTVIMIMMTMVMMMVVMVIVTNGNYNSVDNVLGGWSRRGWPWGVGLGGCPWGGLALGGLV